MSSKTSQRFNHVAMTVPAELLGAEGREQLLAFYGEVFGWTEMPTMTEDRKHLVLRAHSNEQFVFLAAGGEPMRTNEMDHFGLSVETPAELDGLLERVQKFRLRDDRVRIVDRKTEDFKVLKLHSFYVGYLLPLMVEVQCYDWAKDAGPQARPGK